MAVLTEIHFELCVPNPKKFKPIYMKPVNNSFLLKEVLADIDSIISNTDHEQVYQYTEALIKFKHIRCWTYIFSILTILIAVVWCAYMFLVCRIITAGKHSNNCNYMDYTNNHINQACWCAFIVTTIITIVLIIYGQLSFNNKAKKIIHQWITSIKQEIQCNIDKRKYKSPQHSFVLNYQTNYRSNVINGILTVKKRTGGTVETSEVMTTTKKKRTSKMGHIMIDSNTECVEDPNSQELAYLNQTTPITEQSNTGHQSVHQPQISMEMLNEYANTNNAMLNQLVHNNTINQIPNQMPNQIQYNNNNYIPINKPLRQPIGQPMIHNNISYSNASGISNNNLNLNSNNIQIINKESMRQLPPIIPNPVDIVDESQDNKYVNQYDYGAGDYGQNAQYNDFV